MIQRVANLALLTSLALLLLALMLVPSLAHAARLKDIADVEGVRGNQLFGFGYRHGRIQTRKNRS